MVARHPELLNPSGLLLFRVSGCESSCFTNGTSLVVFESCLLKSLLVDFESSHCLPARAVATRRRSVARKSGLSGRPTPVKRRISGSSELWGAIESQSCLVLRCCADSGCCKGDCRWQTSGREAADRQIHHSCNHSHLSNGNPTYQDMALLRRILSHVCSFRFTEPMTDVFGSV